MVSPSETAISENSTDHCGLQYRTARSKNARQALSGPLRLAVRFSRWRGCIESLGSKSLLRHHPDYGASVTLELAGANAGDDRQRCQRDRPAARHLEQRRIVKNHIGRQFLTARFFETPGPQRLPQGTRHGIEFCGLRDLAI